MESNSENLPTAAIKLANYLYTPNPPNLNPPTNTQPPLVPSIELDNQIQPTRLTSQEQIIHLQSQINLLTTHLYSIAPAPAKPHRRARLLEIANLTTLVPSAQKFLDNSRHFGFGSSEDEENHLQIAKLLSQRSRLVVYLSNKMVLPLSDIPTPVLSLLSKAPKIQQKVLNLMAQGIEETFESINSSAFSTEYFRIKIKEGSEYSPAQILTVALLPYIRDILAFSIRDQ